MKKTKLLLLILSLTLIFALSSCDFLDKFHACEDVCPVCGKCLETDCNMACCKDKCQGHQPTEHACENVCSECGKCLDVECAEPACTVKCEGHEPAHVCAESLTKTDAISATCDTDGSAEYYTCSCGKIYSDAEAKNETTLEDSIIPALGHDEQSHEAKAPTCTEKGYDAYVTCSRCDYTTYAEKVALGHDEQSHDAKAPTCTEAGYDAYVTCSRCDYTTYAEKVALGHDEQSHDAKAPTCTAIGWDAYETCSRCDYTTYVEKSALDHDVVSHDAQAPTCTEIGWDAYETCSRCDYTTYVEKSALDHDVVSHDAQAPTCTAIGWDAYETCSRCDYTTYVEKSALGHDEQSHEAKAPTCTAIGWDAYVTCSRCDYTTKVEKAALGHDEQSHDAKAPTCTEKGWDAYVTCSRCDYNTKVEKEVINHNYEWIVDLQPTVNATGLKHEECTMCHGKRNENTPIDKLVCTHNLIKTAAIAATCLTAGNKEYYTCSVCNKVYSNAEGTLETTVENSVIAALGHDEQSHDAKAPTCTEGGYDAYVTCSRCDYTTYADKEALGHDEQSHNAQAPTCTEIGWDAYVTCSRCDYTTKVEKAALGHDEQSHDAKAPTCTEGGYDAYVTCSRCDYTTYADKEALGHDEQSHEAKAPTCTEGGYDAYVTCSRCDYTTYNAVPETGHDYKETVTAPTCEAQGYTTHVCQNDATHTYTDSYVDALGHSYGEWTIATAPTYEVEGALSRACAKCSDTDEKNIGTVSEANGYSLVIGGVVSRWQFTDGDFSITIDLENKDAVTNTYSDDASAWYVGFDASGAMIKIDGYKTTNAPWDGTNLSFGDSGKTYYTTVTSPKATTVTLIINCARNKAKPFFTADTEHCIDNLMVNGSADGVICFAGAQLSVAGWHAYTDYAIATLFLQEGDNVISFKSATTVNFKGIGYVSTEELHIHSDEYIEATKPNCTEAGLSYGIVCSTCNKVILAQETVDALGHTNAWTHTMTTKPTYEAEGLIESVEACTVCGVVNATNSFTVPTVNKDTEGYELLVTGVASRWQYTYDNAEFIIELMETDVNTNTYSFGVEAWYSDRNGTGTPIGSAGFKHTTAVWNATYSCYGQSNRVYTTTIVVDKPTAVTLTITAARNKAKPYFSETGAEHVLDWIKVNGSESNVIYNMDARLSSTSWYGWKTAAVATLFLEEGVNVISFDTSTNTNFQGIGFLSTEEIKLAEDKVELDLMSFNIRQDTDSGIKSWAQRKEHLIASIIALNPSVICFQEVDKNQGIDLQNGLAEAGYKVVWYARQTGTNPEGLAVAYKTDTWNEISSEVFWLSETPDQISKGWDEAYYRISVNVLLQHKTTGKHLNVFSVHLGLTETSQVNGMQVVLDRAAQYDYPAFIAGDFNCTDKSATYLNTSLNYKDAQKYATTTEIDDTFHSWGNLAGDGENYIIDFCFLSNKDFAPITFDIRTEDKWGTDNANYLSDHYALVTKVALLVPHTHKEVIDEAVAADCTNTGLTEGKHCSSCGEVLVAQDVTEMLGHIYTDSTDAECDRCDFVRDIACAHANKVAVSAKDATCTEAGNTAGEMCSDCGEVFVDEVFPALGHTNAASVMENEIAPTLDSAGSCDSVVYCSVCNEELSRKSFTLPSLNITDYKAETSLVDSVLTTVFTFNSNEINYSVSVTSTKYISVNDQLYSRYDVAKLNDGNVVASFDETNGYTYHATSEQVITQISTNGCSLTITGNVVINSSASITFAGGNLNIGTDSVIADVTVNNPATDALLIASGNYKIIVNKGSALKVNVDTATYNAVRFSHKNTCNFDVYGTFATNGVVSGNRYHTFSVYEGGSFTCGSFNNGQSNTINVEGVMTVVGNAVQTKNSKVTVAEGGTLNVGGTLQVADGGGVLTVNGTLNVSVNVTKATTFTVGATGRCYITGATNIIPTVTDGGYAKIGETEYGTSPDML